MGQSFFHPPFLIGNTQSCNFELFSYILYPLDTITVYRYIIVEGGMLMIVNIPYMTINDICNGKTSLGKCNAETVYQIAKAFNVTVEELLEAAKEQRCSFSIFKSNVCHRLKELGDIDFLLQTLSNDDIRRYYEKAWYPECLYLLAMVDYISRLNQISLCSDYDDLRSMKLSEKVYPSGVLALALAEKNDAPKEAAWKEAIPEFKRFNIVENEVRNVI
jgi:hypothetical protein